MSKKIVNPLIVLGSMAAGALIYGSCSNDKKKKKRNYIKKSVCREIEFKEKASEVEKAIAVNEAEKHILDELYKQDWRGLIIKSIRFFVKAGIDDRHVHICGKVRLAYMMKDATEPKDGKPTKPTD